MNKKRLTAILAAGVLSVTAVNSVAVMAEAQQSTESEENGAMAIPADEAGMAIPFRWRDCSFFRRWYSHI